MRRWGSSSLSTTAGLSPTSGGALTSCTTSTRSGWGWVTRHVHLGTTRPTYLTRTPHASPSPTRTTSTALCVLCCVGDVACRVAASSLTTTSLMPTTWVGGMGWSCTGGGLRAACSLCRVRHRLACSASSLHACSRPARRHRTVSVRCSWPWVGMRGCRQCRS